MADRIDAVIEDGSLRRLARERSAAAAPVLIEVTGPSTDADVAVGRGAAVVGRPATVAVRAGVSEPTPPEGAASAVRDILGATPRYLRGGALVRRRRHGRPAGGAGGQPRRRRHPAGPQAAQARPLIGATWRTSPGSPRSPSCVAARRWPCGWAAPRRSSASTTGASSRCASASTPSSTTGSFHEVGTIAGKATYTDGELVDLSPTNFVMGRGRIHGRPVVVGADDFTVRGGAADASIWEKQVYSEQMATELRIPIVRLVDGTGGGGSVKSLETMGHTYVPANPGWEHVVANLGEVPVVALALGSVAGLGAARVATSHYALMVKDTAQVFVAGPPVVARAGEQVTKEELGGAHIHGTNGTVDDVVDSEEEAFERTRRFLSYLPSSVHDVAARGPITDDPDRRDEWLISAVPKDRRKVYKIRRVIESVLDTGSFLEIGKGWGRSAVTGLGRLDGWPVAVLASDPYVYGAGWTASASDKVTRLVDLADTFHLPIVHLVDQPGFVIGTDAERASTIRRGSPGARRRLPGPGAAVRRHPATRVRRGRRRPPERVRSCGTGTRGRRATGARCRSKAASRRRTRRSSRSPTIRRRCAPRSRPGSTSCAHRSAPPRRSSSRRSSTRATPARCSSSSPTSRAAAHPRPRHPPLPPVPPGCASVSLRSVNRSARPSAALRRQQRIASSVSLDRRDRRRWSTARLRPHRSLSSWSASSGPAAVACGRRCSTTCSPMPSLPCGRRSKAPSSSARRSRSTSRWTSCSAT